MSLSPFFQQLRSAYEAELDDLTSDSEGRGVLLFGSHLGSFEVLRVLARRLRYA